VINEKYIPYYLKWISDDYRFFELSASQALDNDQREQFLKHLSKSHEDWQVNQADHALRLYGYFLSLAQKKSLKDTSDATEEWRLLEAKTRDALRLRHRSQHRKDVFKRAAPFYGLCPWKISC